MRHSHSLFSRLQAALLGLLGGGLMVKDYFVELAGDAISDWRSRWPASGLGRLHSVFAQFDGDNGDLLDLGCNSTGVYNPKRPELSYGSCFNFDGEALKALVDDMQCLVVFDGNAPEEHCRNPDFHPDEVGW